MRILPVLFLATCLYSASVVLANRTLKIGAFNIQSFGKTKYKRTAVMDYLVKIVSEYDVIIIQEIKDKSQTMIYKFLADCQQNRNFSMALSKRLGRTTRYMEQYALFYDQDKVTLDKHTVYEDPADIFHREPMIAQITTKSTPTSSLTLMGVHVDPDDVVEELGEMPNAYTWAVQQGYVPDAIMMGDFNGDCSYLRSKDFNALPLYTNNSYTWLIDHSADTTVAVKTDCAYDRFIVVGDPAKFSKTVVDKFDVTFGLDENLAKKVSDHYPIQTEWSY